MFILIYIHFVLLSPGVNGCLPKRVGGSRWMPHMKTALETLFKSFPGYISHLQNKNAKAEGLVKILGSLNVSVWPCSPGVVGSFVSVIANFAGTGCYHRRVIYCSPVYLK